MNRFKWWLEGEQALTLSVGCVETVKGPYGHFVVFGSLLETLADCECIVLMIGAIDDKQLVDIVGVPFIEEPLLLKRWIEAKQQICLSVEDFF